MSYLKTKRSRLDERHQSKPATQTEANAQAEHQLTSEASVANEPLDLANLEHQLSEAYQDQTIRYENALYVANQIGSSLASDEGADELQDQLGELMESISIADQEIASMRQHWDASGRSANQNLRRSVERLRSTIEKVISAVSDAENIALEAKERLEPHLGTAMSAKRMMAAYNAAQTKSS